MLATIATKSAGQIKNELIDNSPYLSDTVMITYANKPAKGKDHVSPGHIKEVIIANSPVTKSVMAAVEDRKLPPVYETRLTLHKWVCLQEQN